MYSGVRLYHEPCLKNNHELRFYAVLRESGERAKDLAKITHIIEVRLQVVMNGEGMR